MVIEARPPPPLPLQCTLNCCLLWPVKDSWMLLKTLQRASLDFCFSAPALPLLRLAVLCFPLSCLCLQGWPMNRQLHEGRSFHSALVSADGGHLNVQLMGLLPFSLRGCAFTPATAASATYGDGVSFFFCSVVRSSTT